MHIMETKLKKPFLPLPEILQNRLVVSHNMFGIDLARSLPPNIIPFGPIQNEAQIPPLEPEMEKLLTAHAKANRRVVFMAFGTLARMDLAPEVCARLLAGVDLFLEKNQDCAVIWASTTHDHDLIKPVLDKHKERLSTPSWINQRRVLLHPAVHVSVTHGGYGSVSEAIFAAKPLLVLPFFGDQPMNAYAAEDAKYARQLDKYTFTAEDMTKKLEELLVIDSAPLYRLQQIAKLNSETSPVVISNALLRVATKLRIAVVVTFGTRSHVAPLFEALRWLVEHKDHNVEITYIHTNHTKSFPNEALYVKYMYCGFERDMKKIGEIATLSVQTDKPVDDVQMHIQLFSHLVEDYELGARHYLEIFERERFDLIISDFFDRAVMDAALESDTKLATMCVLGFHNVGGAWYVPNFFQPCPLETWMTSTWTRLKAMAHMAPFIMHVSRVEKQMQQIMETKLKFKKPFRPIQEIFQTRLVLSHNMFGFDLARTLPPNIIPYGPIQNEKHIPPLEPEIESGLAAHTKANRKVVFMAFGSAVRFDASRQVYTRLLAGVDLFLEKNQDCAVIWPSTTHDAALTKPVLDKHQERLSTPSWINQRRVLLHPAVHVFVTHGGFGSITEAFFAAKPMLFLPFFADQPMNAYAAEDGKYGLQLDKYTFTAEEMAKKLQELLVIDRAPLYRLQQIARLNSETSPVVVSNAVLCAATVGVEHLLPPDLGISWR
ncbi:TPA: hypothetical protein N0F65_002448 [Lagenidium giganteum]|uniref:Glucuronosyltransferase n=1 Tax=Lagenidium giganteum TaxID=4803 RepID=A0AAV2YJK9_9STRA|nr:TPA: hypothetical protein N0F65_002448 [Lagenidium giganteum]